MTRETTAPEQLVLQAMVQEHERLARELHDTVSALSTIAEEASRTLSEMRTMAGSLRDQDGELALAPRRGVGDTPSLTRTHNTPPPLRTERDGSSMTIRVLIADDQEIVRAGLAMIIDTQDDLEVVAQASDGAEAVELARTLDIDVGLFDIRMPVLDGVEATRQLARPEADVPLPIVIMTTFDTDESVHRALKAGARGFLHKDAGPDLLFQAIRAAASGEALIAPCLTARLLQAFASDAASTAPDEPVQPIEPLTGREEEVLRTVAQGRTNAEIADDLHISLSTAKFHLAALMQKLGARNRVEISMWAYETGRV